MTLSASVYNLFDKNFENYGPTKTGASAPTAATNWSNSYRQGAGRPALVGVGEHHVLTGAQAGPGARRAAGRTRGLAGGTFQVAASGSSMRTLNP